MILKRVIALSVAVLAGATAMAEDAPPPFPDFTFKRVGLPEAGAPRIRVQIEPGFDPFAATAAPSDVPPGSSDAAESAPDAFGWYWDAVSPALSDAGSGRLAAALAPLEATSSETPVPVPSVQLLSTIAAAHGRDILLATVGTSVSPALVLAVIAVESGGRADAVSRAGAAGLMQLMPDTADRFSVEDRVDPGQSIRGGVAYLDWLMGTFARDPVIVLAAYNAGEGAVRRHEGVPPYAETRGYVPKVLAAWQVARGLCLTPPQLISDGCVFAVMAERG